MARFSCLAVGMLLALIFLLLLITCRSRGFPFYEGNHSLPIQGVNRLLPYEVGTAPATQPSHRIEEQPR